jgi:acetyltransferase-like isoleucine patch superfamily enzyme
MISVFILTLEEMAKVAVGVARAVIVKDVVPWIVVAGNPARLVKMRQEHPDGEKERDP